MSENGFVLYARSSFFEGLSRLIDFTGALNTYNESESPEVADARAILSDWEAVGRDLIAAQHQFIKQIEPSITNEP